ncbi:MAG: hypothetical protein RIM23_18060 [Coleofasciculus sp. G3-WIS-01]|uniref:hypothetical protein n=1 Tax=Coleofasciculus sp. G3-WIS-01 TaxID=3069528 RepID=UPI0033040BDB
MMIKSLRYIVGLGLVGGFAVLLSPAAEAQIEVTGGRVAGEAGFFVPSQDAAGNVTLFDATVQQLRIESPNGVTTNSQFVPTAASFTDNGDGMPNAGDTGVLKGRLSGIAFTQNGGLVTFSGRDTLLNFTLDSFTESLNLTGSLISPEMVGDAPPVFLPGLEDVTVSTSGFAAASGELQIGDFEAGLDSGLIDLAPTLQFRGGGSTMPPASGQSALVRRIKFKFEGEDLAAGNYLYDSTTEEISFVGNANQKFEIQTVGSSGTTQEFKFKIKGEGGIVDATLSDLEEIKIEGSGIDTDVALDRFEIKGKDEGEISGFASVFSANGLAFTSTGDSDRTKFKFEQDGAKVEGEARSVSFRAFAGVSNIDDVDTDVDEGFDFDYENPNDENDIDLVCVICGGPRLNVSNITFGGSTVSIENNNKINFRSGDSLIVFTGDGSGQSQVSSTSSASATASATASASTTATADASSANTNLIAFSGTSSTAETQYEISNSIRFTSASAAQGRVRVNYTERSGSRYLIATRTSGGVAVARQGYKMVGPSSRCFPGLVGLRQIPDEELDTVVDEDDTAMEMEDENTNIDDDMDVDMDDDDDDDDDDEMDDDDDDDDDDQGQGNMNRNFNQGIGNGPEGGDPGNSAPRGGSNDEGGRMPGQR